VRKRATASSSTSASSCAISQPRRVGARDLERPLREIHRGDPRERAFGRDRERDRPAAGAEVEDVHDRIVWNPLEGEFDQALGIRPRHQRVAAERELERPERLMADQQRDRHALATPRGERPETRERVVVHFDIVVRYQPATRGAQHVGKQQFRIRARRLAADAGDGLVQQRAQPHAQACAGSGAAATAGACSSVTATACTTAAMRAALCTAWAVRPWPRSTFSCESTQAPQPLIADTASAHSSKATLSMPGECMTFMRRPARSVA
jgi:hypothetical protein